MWIKTPDERLHHCERGTFENKMGDLIFTPHGGKPVILATVSVTTAGEMLNRIEDAVAKGQVLVDVFP